MLGEDNRVCPQMKSGACRDSASSSQLILPQQMLHPSTLSGSTLPHQTSAPDVAVIQNKQGRVP